MHSLLFFSLLSWAPSFAVRRQRVCVCVCAFPSWSRSVQRYSIERFVVHSYVPMTQELKCSMICCHYRYRPIGSCTSRFGLSLSSIAVLRYSLCVRGKMTGGSFGSSTKEEKKKEERKNQNLPKGMACACLGPLSKLSDVNPNDTSSSPSFPTHSIPRHAIPAMTT